MPKPSEYDAAHSLGEAAEQARQRRAHQMNNRPKRKDGPTWGAAYLIAGATSALGAVIGALYALWATGVLK